MTYISSQENLQKGYILTLSQDIQWTHDIFLTVIDRYGYCSRVQRKKLFRLKLWHHIWTATFATGRLAQSTVSLATNLFQWRWRSHDGCPETQHFKNRFGIIYMAVKVRPILIFKVCLIKYIKHTGLFDSAIYLHHFLFSWPHDLAYDCLQILIANHIALF